MDKVIMVVTHKQFAMPADTLYRAVVVGKNKNEIHIADSWRDDKGVNIAQLNYRYCELTALYYFWKNKQNEYDCCGLVHYRRIFTKNPFSNSYRALLNDYDIKKALGKADVILPLKFYWDHSVMTHYYHYGFGKKKDLLLVGQIMNERYPQYSEVYRKILRGSCASYCNMFVMKRKELNLYCEWLFSILQEFDNRADLTGYTSTELRVDGALSEILLNVWVQKNKLKVKYYPIAYMEASYRGQLAYAIKTLRNRRKDFVRRRERGGSKRSI